MWSYILLNDGQNGRNRTSSRNLTDRSSPEPPNSQDSSHDNVNFHCYLLTIFSTHSPEKLECGDNRRSEQKKICILGSKTSCELDLKKK